MKKKLLVALLLLNGYLAHAQEISSWFISLNKSKDIVADNPGPAIDIAIGNSYLMTGSVKMKGGVSFDTDIFLRFTNDLGRATDVKLGTVKLSNDKLDFNFYWIADNYGSSSGNPVQATILVGYTSGNNYITGETTTYITVNPRIKLSVSGATMALTCGTKATLSAAAKGGVPPYSYKWYPADNLSSGTISNPVFSGTGSQTYQITVTDSSWPVQSAYNFFWITVNPLAAPNINGSSIFYLPCANSTSTYTYTITNLPAGVTNVTWKVLNFPNATVSYNYTGALATGINISLGTGIQAASMNSASGTVQISNQFQITCSYATPKCTSATTTSTITQYPSSCAPGPVTVTPLSISPNPTTEGKATINYSVDDGGEVRLVVLDSNGNTILSKDAGYLQPGNYSENVTLSQKGILIVKVINGSSVQTQRILAQ